MSSQGNKYLSGFPQLIDDKRFFHATHGVEQRIDFQRSNNRRISLPYFAAQDIVFDEYLNEDDEPDGEFIMIHFPGTGRITIFGEKLLSLYEGLHRQNVSYIRESVDGEGVASDCLFIESSLVEMEADEGEDYEGDDYEEDPENP